VATIGCDLVMGRARAFHTLFIRRRRRPSESTAENTTSPHGNVFQELNELQNLEMDLDAAAFERKDENARKLLKGVEDLLKGAPAIHTGYGEQFRAEEGVLKTPSTALIARYLSSHSAFRGTGVGTVAAHRLIERFGTELPRLLNDRIETTVAEFVGAEQAFALKEAWRGLFGEQALLNWMLERGLDLRWADKLRRIYGDRAREEVESNPYILIALSNWREVDRLAHKNFGIQAEDTRRMVAAAECSVYELLDSTGSTLFDPLTGRRLSNKPHPS
jgi:hypothetical protein